MNCSPNISIALSLLALTAGVWFLYKVQKENLNILYKVAAWFIIIATLLNMACCGMRCCMQACMMRQNCYQTEQCRMNMNDCGMRNQMCMKGGMKCDDDDKCEPGCEKACCTKDEKGCEPGCKKACCAEKKMCQDSVVQGK